MELPTLPMKSKEAGKWLRQKDHYEVMRATGVAYTIVFRPFQTNQYLCECGTKCGTRPPVFCSHLLGHTHAINMKKKLLSQQAIVEAKSTEFSSI